MSAKHPIIAVTGSSGAGTSTSTNAFRSMFHQLGYKAAVVEGDSFHRYTRPEMDVAIRKAREQGRHISYFGPEANDFGLLESFFQEYGQSGSGQYRRICTASTRLCRSTRCRAPSPPGRRCRGRQTCCSTKGCTAAW